MKKLDEVTARQIAVSQRTITQLEKAWGRSHVKLLPAMTRLGDLYFALADYANAEQLYWRSLSIACKAYDDGHPVVASSLKQIAEALHAQDRFDEAERLYLWSFRTSNAIKTSEGDMTPVVCRLASLYRQVDAPIKAKWMEHKLGACLSALTAAS